MPLVEHFYELRRRLFVSIVAVGLAMVVGFVFFGPIFHVITLPYCDLKLSHCSAGSGTSTLVTLGVLDPFKIRLKVATFTGILLSAPIWLYQLWAFITPGLKRHERRWALSFVTSSVLLFAAGAAMSYLTLSKGLGFLLHLAGNDVTALVEVNKYLNYAQAMTLVFGVAFEFPLLVIMLNLAGLVTASRLWSWWRPMVFGITVFAAVATPSQDPFTMSALAVPLVVLYFVSVGVARGVDRRRARHRVEADAQLAAELGMDPDAFAEPFVDID